MSEVAQLVHHYYFMWQLICSFHDQLVLGGLSTTIAEPVLTTESLQRITTKIEGGFQENNT